MGDGEAAICRAAKVGLGAWGIARGHFAIGLGAFVFLPRRAAVVATDTRTRHRRGDGHWSPPRSQTRRVGWQEGEAESCKCLPLASSAIPTVGIPNCCISPDTRQQLSAFPYIVYAIIITQ